jgi:hypothetical protein
MSSFVCSTQSADAVRAKRSIRERAVRIFTRLYSSFRAWGSFALTGRAYHGLAGATVLRDVQAEGGCRLRPDEGVLEKITVGVLGSTLYSIL